MNYYQQLLESYGLMKQRKLRIVFEQTDPQDAELIALIKQLGTGQNSETGGEQNGAVVFQGDPQGKPNLYTGSLGKEGFSAFILDGGVLNPNDSPTAEKIISRLRGGSEEEVLDQSDDELNSEIEYQRAEEQKWKEFASSNPLAHSFGWSPEDLFAGIRHIFFDKVQPNIDAYLEKAETLIQVDGKEDHKIIVGNQSGSLE